MKIKEKIKITWKNIQWKYQGIVLAWDIFKFPSWMEWIWAIKYLPVSLFISKDGDEVWKSRFFKKWERVDAFKFNHSNVDWKWSIYIEKARTVVNETSWREHRFMSKFLQDNCANMSKQERSEVLMIVEHELKTMSSCVWNISRLMVDEKSRITNMSITWISAICLAVFHCISLNIGNRNSELLTFINGVEIFLLIILLYFAFKLPLAIAKFLMLAKLSMKGAFERVEVNCFKSITYFKQLKIREEAESLKKMNCVVVGSNKKIMAL